MHHGNSVIGVLFEDVQTTILSCLRACVRACVRARVCVCVRACGYECFSYLIVLCGMSSLCSIYAYFGIACLSIYLFVSPHEIRTLG